MRNYIKAYFLFGNLSVAAHISQSIINIILHNILGSWLTLHFWFNTFSKVTMTSPSVLDFMTLTVSEINMSHETIYFLGLSFCMTWSFKAGVSPNCKLSNYLFYMHKLTWVVDTRKLIMSILFIRLCYPLSVIQYSTLIEFVYFVSVWFICLSVFTRWESISSGVRTKSSWKQRVRVVYLVVSFIIF